MSKATEVIDLKVAPSYEEAKQRAADDATSSMSMSLMTVMYEQAGRPYFSTALPIGALTRMVRFESAPKGTSEPEKYTNRPVITDHVQTIAKYLEERLEGGDKYILPAIALNVRERLRVHSFGTTSALRGALLVVPMNTVFHVTDGQHRIRALQAALGSHPELANDAVSVTIVVEPELAQVHQDFADCAQSKPIPPSLLTVYDAQDVLSGLTLRVVDAVPFFQGRLEKVGKTVSKRSNYLYTINHVRMSIGAALTGDASSSTPALRAQVNAVLPTGSENQEWFGRLKWFYNSLTDELPEWGIVRDANSSNETIPEFADFRTKYLHFGGTGLTIIGGAGHVILGLDDASEREAKMKALAHEVDWRRVDDHGGSFWEGTVLVNGKMVTSRYAVQGAVDKVLEHIGLSRKGPMVPAAEVVA
jgi:DNA sulfur modification protein DndB